jgi:RNA polymerase sigma-70 factor (ECF subfamily)
LLTEAELVQVYREHTAPLYRYVSRRVGGDRTLAEDIVQDAWLRAVAAWPRKGVPDHPLAWLMRVARNLLASHFRRQRPLPVEPAELDLERDQSYPETPCGAALVSWGLARLRQHQAELIEAFYFDGKSTREIAQAWGLSERAVEGRLRRARQALEKRLRPHYGSEHPPGNRAGAAVRRIAAAELPQGGNGHA